VVGGWVLDGLYYIPDVCHVSFFICLFFFVFLSFFFAIFLFGYIRWELSDE